MKRRRICLRFSSTLQYESPSLKALTFGTSGSRADGRPVTVFTRTRVDATAAEVSMALAALEEARAAAGSPEQVDEIDAALVEANRAADALAANLEQSIQTGSHIAIPADSKTATYLEELGPGGRAFIAH